MTALLQAPLWLAKSLVSVVSSLTGTHVSATDSHLTIMHAPYLVLYRGSDTYVPVTVLKHNQEGDRKAASGRSSGQVQVVLVRRGWRAGSESSRGIVFMLSANAMAPPSLWMDSRQVARSQDDKRPGSDTCNRARPTR